MRIELQPGGAVVDGTMIRLTEREQALLSWLVAHPDTPQSRETLLTEVWGYAQGASSRTVDSTLNRLRGKLAGGGDAIRAIRGQGWVYRSSPGGDGPPFVGRDDERAAVDRWLAGRGSLLTVVGAPGIGKSALVARCLGPRGTRIDGSSIRGSEDWFRAVDSAGSRILWLDDADRLIDLLRALLPAKLERRLLVTCRRPLHHPAEELLRLGRLTEASAGELAKTLLTRQGSAVPEEVARRIAPAEGNPLLVEIGDGGPERVDLAQSLDALTADQREGLERLATVGAPVMPPSLAVALAGYDAVLTDLLEGSLAEQLPGGWRVPAIVRIGLRSPGTVHPIVARWVVERVRWGQAGGDARWIPFLRDLGPERPLLEWVALTADDPDAIRAAVVALDEHARLVPGHDLLPLHDRLVETGDPDALLRRATWHSRLGHAAAAVADHDAYQRALHSRTEGLRGLLASAMMAFRGGDVALAEALARQVLSPAEAHADHRIEAMAWFTIAQVALWRGDYPGALGAARAARTVPVKADRAGHSVTSFFGRYLHEAGFDDEGRATLDESRRIAVQVGFDEGVLMSDGMAAWVDAVTMRDPSAVVRLSTICDGLDRLESTYAAATRLRCAWAEIVVGAAERGLSELRRTTATLLAQRYPLEAAEGRAFAVAGRVRLGLEPHARWMVPDALEGDPAVRELVGAFEARAAGDPDTVRAVLDRTAGITGSRARALRGVLLQG